MAKQTFTLWDNELFTALDAGVDGDGTFDLAISEEQSNSVSLRSLKLIMQYRSIAPPAEDAQGNTQYQSFGLDCLVEGDFGGSWVPVAYQFTPFNRPSRGETRIIQLQPSIAGFDAGVDDIMYVGDSTIARVSRQQGVLPDSKFRVRIRLTERGFGSANAFESILLSGMGEAFDV